ncbi:MAG: hypothetical protein P8124_13730, partial [Gammaproteobacteria bacterium]
MADMNRIRVYFDELCSKLPKPALPVPYHKISAVTVVTIFYNSVRHQTDTRAKPMKVNLGSRCARNLLRLRVLPAKRR